MVRALLALVLVTVVALPARSGLFVMQERPAPGVAAIVPSDDDENTSILVEFRLQNRIVSPAFPALLVEGKRICLPFKALCDVLQISGSVDLANLRAFGTLPLPHGRFGLDMKSGKAQMNASVLVVDAWRARPFEGDLYVDAHLLEAWLPLRFNFSYSRLELKAKPLARLPIEEVWDREARRAKLRSQAGPELSAAPPLSAPPRAIGAPYLDFTLSSDLESRTAGSSFGATPRLQISGAADLLYMSAKWFSAGTWENPFELARLQLGRTDTRPILLGPMRARQFTLGDTWFAASPYFAKTRLGRGFEVSSFPTNRSADSNRTTLQGDASPGWQVELYRNEELIEFQTADATGTYQFRDVPLVLGSNEFRIVQFGPNGEVREEKRSYMVGAGLAAKGERNYRIAMLRQDDDLLTSRRLGDPQDRGKLRWIGEFEQGLSSTSSLAFRMARLPFDGIERTYSAVGIRRSLGKAYGTLDGMSDGRGGWGLAASLQTRVRTSNLSWQAGFFGGGFVSEQVGRTARPLSFQSKARLDGNFGPVAGIPISYSLTLDQETDTHGKPRTVLAGRFAANLAGVTYSNSLRTGRQFDDEPSTAGVLGIKKRMGKLWYRADIGYSIQSTRVQSLALAADWMSSRDLRGQFGLRKPLDGSGGGTIFAGLHRRTASNTLSLNLEYGGPRKLTGALVLSMGIGSDPRSGKWNVSSQNLSSTGLVSVRAFLDKNGSGRFDAGDEPLEGVRFRAGRRKLDGATGRDGVVLYAGLATDQPLELSVDSATLEDPMLSPTRDRLIVMPRAGSAAQLEVPMALASDLEGSLLAHRDGKEVPLAGILVRLLNSMGREVASTMTAYDGIYVFERVKPGKYSLQIDPDTLARLGLASMNPEPICIDASGTSALMRPLVAEPSAAADPSIGDSNPPHIDVPPAAGFPVDDAKA